MKTTIHSFLRHVWSCCMLCGLAVYSATAYAGEFQRVYLLALSHDAKYQAAQFSLASSQQAIPIARSSLLPTVTASVAETAVQGKRTIDSPGGGSVSTDLDYQAPTQSVNMRAPLYNAEASERLKQVTAQVSAAEATFVARKAELVERLALAYLQRMLAHDNFVALHAQVHAVVAQRNLMRRRFEQGEGTKTEVAEARANLSQVLVQWADARDQIETTRRSLELVTGVSAPAPLGLEERFYAPALVPSTMETWQQMAVASNPDISYRRHAVEVAKAGVERSSAGHLPRVDLVASTSNSRNESVSSLNQSLTQTSVGLQISIPLYSGGSVKAAVSQALADQSRAESELISEQQAAESEVARLFMGIQNGMSRLRAFEVALESSRVALEGTQLGQASGLRTNSEVLEAMRKVAQAQRDLAQARYDHILQRLRLFNKAGVAPDAVVAYVDELLAPKALMQ
jgi:outer membrane protein, protease secretion system